MSRFDEPREITVAVNLLTPQEIEETLQREREHREEMLLHYRTQEVDALAKSLNGLRVTK